MPDPIDFPPFFIVSSRLLSLFRFGRVLVLRIEFHGVIFLLAASSDIQISSRRRTPGVPIVPAYISVNVTRESANEFVRALRSLFAR